MRRKEGGGMKYNNTQEGRGELGVHDFKTIEEAAGIREAVSL